VIETLVALNVIDDDVYQAYRDAMTPILTDMGGRFRYDFIVDRALKNETGHAVNRVFAITFPDAATRDRFFGDDVYVEIRSRLFDRSVDGYTMIASYEVAD
jgi:uncharacterized protein (DUF1330 family)